MSPQESYQTTILDGDFQNGSIYSLNQSELEGKIPLPFYYPLPEIITISLLSKRRGVMIHACAIKDRQHGIVFAGQSGAGKSTIANLWKSQPGIILLSDDRVIIRKRETNYWIYGTPWHGDANVLSPEAVHLTQIFLLRHADDNKAIHLKPSKAVSRILAQSFPTYWDQAGVEFTLEFITELSTVIPINELGFRPDDTMIDYVKKLQL